MSKRETPTKNTVAGMKWCPNCERRLRADKFGVARNRPDGLTGHCRACRAERSRADRASDPMTTRADLRARYAANPEVWHAKVAVSRAIASGKLHRPADHTACGACGKTPQRLVAHHHLGHAREHWLAVVWRCRSCCAVLTATHRAQVAAAITHAIEESRVPRETFHVIRA
jgi:hypothetical protein